MTTSGDISQSGRWQIEHLVETTSTNSILLEAAESGTVRDRTALLTDYQSAGRGRLDRRWEAPRGANLLVSLLFLEPAVRPSTLTQMVGLAALGAVERVGAVGAGRVALKWPNDLLLDDLKLAGILAQRSGSTGAIVVGIGLNVGWAPEGAASLRDNLDLDVSPREVLDAMLGEFDAFDALEERGDDLDLDVAAKYRDRLATLGQRVRVELPDDAVLEGVAVDLDGHGRLLVEDERGNTHVLDVGDVVHLRSQSSE